MTTIRPVTPEDHRAVAAVVRSAFRDEAIVSLVERLRRDGEHLEWVAEQDGAVIGHVMMSYAMLAGGRIAMLSPLAVAPSHQRQGIGGSLVRACIDGADARGEPAVIVEGDPAYYGRFGFEHAGSLGIEHPAGVPDVAFQVRRLSAWNPDLRGAVVYPPAFDGL